MKKNPIIPELFGLEAVLLLSSFYVILCSDCPGKADSLHYDYLTTQKFLLYPWKVISLCQNTA